MKLRLTPDKNIRVEKTKIGHIPVLILRPAEAVKDRPGVMWIHGGGYILGMKEMVYMSRAADLVKKYGAAVVSPGYRLAWLHPYPAAVNDCYQVLEYMNDHSEDIGFRGDQLMVGGESAGGGLCAAVCMMARDRGIKIAYQMPLYPMISNTDTESSRNNHGKVWNTSRNHLGWRIYLRKNAKSSVSPYAARSFSAFEVTYHVNHIGIALYAKKSHLKPVDEKESAYSLTVSTSSSYSAPCIRCVGWITRFFTPLSTALLRA